MNNIDKYISNEDDENISDITDNDSDDEETRQIVYNALLRNMNKQVETSIIMEDISSIEIRSRMHKKPLVKILLDKINDVKTNKRQFQPRKPPYNLIKPIDINKNNFELNNNDFPSL
jgi:hypothetical protein